MLAHFGTESLHVLQFDPARLVEVAGIGARTAANIAARWDPHRFDRRTLEWVGSVGYRLPTEAEWVRATADSVAADGEAMAEWVWDLDSGPKYEVEPLPLDSDPATDPRGARGRASAHRGPRKLHPAVSNVVRASR